MNVVELMGAIREYNPGADLGMVENAYNFSARVHKGQKRMSGEPYLVHPVAVANIITEMKLDVPTVVTGLLHDTVEDTLATLEEIRDEFGSEVAALVDGVTKISRIESSEHGDLATEADNIRKMFLASARDIRVLLVKLADRTHNLRTLEYLSEEKKQRVARESLEIYAPLAHRLGIHWLKTEFEEISFQVLWPDEYKLIRETLALGRIERGGYVGEVGGLIGKRLEESGLEAEIKGRPKQAYSIYRKMQAQGLGYDEIQDIVAFRVLVDSERDCYDALGIIHKHWRPVPGRFRDYVALPKANMYQSLHTTVIGPYGERMEVQVKTHEMQRVAEFGIAAHWRYKKEGATGEDAAEFGWLRQLLEWSQHVEDPRQFLNSLKEELFAEEVLAFTPKGEPLSFSKGETVVDFAYRIHTEIGDHCTGARVNGQLVPLRYQLVSGDTVEVITTDEQAPVRDWLKFVRSPRAKARIMARLKRDERAKAQALGRTIIERDLARHQIDFARLRREGRVPELLKRFRQTSIESLFESIGYGRIVPKDVVSHLVPTAIADSSSPRRRLKSLFRFLDRRSKQGVIVDAGEELMVHFAKCCQPLPGEKISGVLTRGRGVTVHANTCQRLLGASAERIVEVGWDKGARASRQVKIEVVSRDRPGLLAGMSQAITSAGVNIDRAHVRTTGKASALNIFEVTLGNAEDLDRIKRNLRRVPGVKEVRRVRA
ncbi:MAG: bifunctional (p)ppGpp synthetase/guanosine-3',5'-bis(diphosphate) 3'-pyrophosphohydrolase [Deltaproteobacteria bacterium]